MKIQEEPGNSENIFDETNSALSSIDCLVSENDKYFTTR